MLSFAENKEVFIISQLDAFSVLLAESIKKEKPDADVVFTDQTSTDPDRIQKAKKLGCIVKSSSIEELSFDDPDIKLYIVLMDHDEDKNLNTALLLTDRLRNKVNAEIYTFNSSLESECLLDSIYKGDANGDIRPIKLRRVNTARNQIYLDLLNNSIFDNAVNEYNEKIISVLVVGLGRYGMEMLKAVLWCGQMDGYVLRVHVIDRIPNIESVFYHQCPGIKQRGSQPRNGEDYYELYFHGNVDVKTDDFYRCLYALPETTLAFVSLGNEETNLETALRLRSVFSGIRIDQGEIPSHSQTEKQRPRIVTVINSPEKSVLIKNNQLSNYKKQYYQIDCLGSITDVYSYTNIFIPELESLALRSHMQWGTEEDFNNYEYNRRSSMASAIHKKYRDMLVPDSEAKDILEHKRWNAYMRSTEGYSFGFIRDDLALRHPLLVKYDNLSRAEKDKDSKMNFTTDTPVF